MPEFGIVDDMGVQQVYKVACHNQDCKLPQQD
jgi:hypothetical protein